MAMASDCWAGEAPRSTPSTIAASSPPRPWATTRVMWWTMNETNATSPRKWRLRALWRPPNSAVYHGKRAATEGAIFIGARLDWSDLSHADLRGADCADADFFRANLHGVRDDGARFTGASLATVKRTDVDRLEAEGWTAPSAPRS